MKSAIPRLSAVVLLAALLLSLAVPTLAAEQDCGAKLLAITFDDGPGPYTADLLDALADRNVKATFFIAGYRAEKYPELLQRIVDEGHQLGNHTWDHPNLNTLSAAKIRKEISSVQDLITAAGGSASAWVRPPYGNANATVRKTIQSPLIAWSVDPEDWKYRNADTVCKNLVNGAYDGAILLVHDIHKTSIPGALAAIDKLLDEGYEFVTVEQLLARRGVTPENGKVYYDAKNHGINLPADEVPPQSYDESKLTEHWAYDALALSIRRGWLLPEDDGRWKPNRYLTRGEFVAALGRFCGIPAAYQTGEPMPYTDVSSDDPDAPYIRWAQSAGLMIGANGEFHSGRTLTREQAATVIARFLTLSGRAAETAPLDYTDAARISTWARDGVAQCTALGILQGSHGAFRPKGTLTRAQIATILQRLAQE